MGIWIEDRDDRNWKPGDIGFLVCTSWTIRPDRKDEYRLVDTPARANMSHAIVLTGWAGTTNDVARYGMGVAEVVKVARNGRALVRQLTGKEAASALCVLGYEDLAESIPSTSTYTVELPSALYSEIGELAKSSGKTINAIIVDMLSKVRR